MEGLEERLSSATQNPASPAYRLSRMVSEVTQMQVGMTCVRCVRCVSVSVCLFWGGARGQKEGEILSGLCVRVLLCVML